MSQNIDSYIHLVASGNLFLKDFQNEEAIACYKKAAQSSGVKTWQRDTLLEFYNNLGVAYKRKKELKQAQMVFEEGILIEPNHHIFYSNLFNTQRAQNRDDLAEKVLLKAISLKTKEISHFILLVEFYKEKKKYKEAFEVGAACVNLFKDKYDSHLMLGNLFAVVKSYKQALIPYQTAIKINPNNSSAYNNIGVVYKELGEHDKAKESYMRVLKINPNDSAAHNNLGNLLRNMDNLGGAVKHLEESIRLNPSYADAYSNLGAVYREAKEYLKAKTLYRKALSLSPNHTNANFDLSLIELMEGSYESGWKRYEYRLRMDELIGKLYQYKTPIWKGESLKDKKIVLQNEQGFGDNMMFIRYVSKFVELGAKVIIRTRPQLVRLFKSIQDVESVCSEEEAIPEHDYHFPLLSSPVYFKTTLETIPSIFPYISVKKNLDIIKTDHKKKLKIGLVWSSSRTNKDFKNKYIGLEYYKPLFAVKGSVWYSLQVGDDAKEIALHGLKNSITDVSEKLIDFLATAEAISSLDLIITTDTAVAHLCGAMNKEAWVLVPKPADWRWMQDGDSTPWYGSLKLFRQSKQGDWSELISRIEAVLKKRCS
ncbi:tetratricopeptide repeat protein [Sulfurimonas sp.]|uniref:tetratricopeptide repeat protein n=1 Tax=Sulfurimonas sp. TaxID=2022749 RepID=UPI0025D3023F|nr:tetratricopeptide repeat protein [Sulfurimonas sp.]MDD5158289.1 tetratricopeptide repeat protein [Sulfurimonas sp.]